jgi:hypothetical protein
MGEGVSSTNSVEGEVGGFGGQELKVEEDS